MSSTLEKTVLLRALELVKAGHARGVMARDRWYREVSHNSPRAVRFCAEGALFRAVREIAGKKQGRLALNILKGLGGSEFVYETNDRRGKRGAISLLEARLKALTE